MNKKRAATVIMVTLASFCVLIAVLAGIGSVSDPSQYTVPQYTPRNRAISPTVDYIWGNSPDRAIAPDRVIPEPTAQEYYTIHYLLLPGNAVASVQMTVTAGDVMVGFMLVIVLAVLLVNTAALLKGGSHG